MRERVGFIKKPEQVKNVEANYEDSMPQWRGISVVLRKIMHSTLEGCPIHPHRNDLLNAYSVCSIRTDR